MTVIVTGGAGYIGSHMAHDLVDRGEHVVVVDNLSTGFRELIPAGAELVEGDVADEALVGRIIDEHGAKSVIHFAGSIIVPESVTKPVKYYLNNTVATAKLIAACVAGGVENFIFSSTAAVYGEPESVPIAEQAALAPTSPYGSSKLMSETMLQDAARAHGLRVGILRYFNVAGADPGGRTGQSTRNTTHLIKLACQAALGLRAGLSIFGDDYPTPDGTGVRDYIHVCDLIDAHRLGLEHLRAGGDGFVFNCGYGQGYSVRDVITAVEQVAGLSLTVSSEPRRPGDPATVVAEASRIRERLGWQPARQDLSLIVEHALAWEKQLSER